MQAINNLRKEAEAAETSRKEVERVVHSSRDRLDNVTSVMFAALGVLIAAIATFATKAPSDLSQHFWDPTVFFLCWATTVLALFSWVRSRSESDWWKWVRFGIGVLAIAIVALLINYETARLHDSQARMDEVSKRVNAIEKVLLHPDGTPK